LDVSFASRAERDPSIATPRESGASTKQRDALRPNPSHCSRRRRETAAAAAAAAAATSSASPLGNRRRVSSESRLKASACVRATHRDDGVFGVFGVFGVSIGTSSLSRVPSRNDPEMVSEIVSRSAFSSSSSSPSSALRRLDRSPVPGNFKALLRKISQIFRKNFGNESQFRPSILIHFSQKNLVLSLSLVGYTYENESPKTLVTLS
jgi:hypothetical protein